MSADPPALRRSGFRQRATVLLVALTTGIIVAFGWVEVSATLDAALEQARQQQNARAAEARHALLTSLRTLNRHVEAVNQLPLQDSWLGLQVRREEFGRLAKLQPAAETITFQGAKGRELLSVSRRAVDSSRIDGTPVAASTQTASPLPETASAEAAAKTGDYRVQFERDHAPSIELRFPEPPSRSGGETRVKLSLLTWSRELRDVLDLENHEVYAIDSQGTLALHKDTSRLFKTAFATGPVQPPASNYQAFVNAVHTLKSSQAETLTLRTVLPVQELGWFVVVEQPRTAILAPVTAAIWRTFAFLTLGAVVAVAAAALLADRLSRPVQRLHRAVRDLTSGALDTRITLHTHDELEDLAHQFNRMAASLQANVAELEDKVAARTLELQRASQAKSDFLAQMSHELRTPLNAILGFADVLREGMAGRINDEQREYLTDIHASGLHLLSLINDVLDLSRIEAGQLQLEWADFDVSETAESALVLVRQGCLQKGLQLLVQQQPGTQLWHGDARRVKQMLVNLLANALKFTPTGGRIDLRIFLKPAGDLASAAEPTTLCLQVQDTGSGIAPEDHERVFKEFEQAGDNTEGRAAGSGLGLPLVRRLARAHGGEVTLASALGAGATFTVTLPQRSGAQA